MVEVAFTLPLSTLIVRAFMGAIPREIDEPAIIDGASPMRQFVMAILPLLRPAIITVSFVSSVAIYNDFTNPHEISADQPEARRPLAGLTSDQGLPTKDVRSVQCLPSPAWRMPAD